MLVDQKLDMTTTQLQNMEELMYFALMMFKCISPSDPTRPFIATVPSQPVDQSVATKIPQAESKPHITTTSKPNSSPSKKGKKNDFSCFSCFVYFILFNGVYVWKMVILVCFIFFSLAFDVKKWEK